MNNSIGCFYIDSCVILADIFKESMRIGRIDKFKKYSSSQKIPCYVSDSVKKETYEVVQRTSDLLGNIVRETIRYGLEESRKKRNIPLTEPVTVHDVKILENLFSYFYDAMKKYDKDGFPSPHPIAPIEEWCIGYLGERLDQGIEINIDQFLTELVKLLLELTSSFEDLYDNMLEFQKDYLRVNDVSADPLIVARIEANIGIHDPDSIHLASAISHQDVNKEKTVFVTLDYNTILSKKDLMWKQHKIECCDPLYSIYHLK